MLKVAFVGDSFSAYEQAGQQKNSWTYLLAKHFPQHTYFNYSLGGRGFDYYHMALLDAKIREADVIFTNKTFLHRTVQLVSDEEHTWQEQKIDDNYYHMELFHICWYSQHSGNNWVQVKQSDMPPESVKKAIATSLQNKSTSTHYMNYNERWWNNMQNLYNFKHIVKLELLYHPWDHYPMPKFPKTAYAQLREQFGIEKALYGIQKELEEEIIDKVRDDVLFNKGLIISPTDDHWSPLANKWVFDNYIMPKAIDILSEK
jgi:hypothetical protein